jgi:sugar phosphate isomerase/epimerase
MKRRTFLQTSAALTAAGLLPWTTAEAALIPSVGIQLFSIPKMLEKDFRGGMEFVSKLGFRELELYGPFPFSTAAAKQNWARITPSLGFSGSGYFGKTVTEVKSILADNKLTTPAIHTDIDTMRTSMDKLGEAGQSLGFTYIGLPSLPAEYRKTLDDYKRAADEFNRIGALAKKAGLRFTYHNHGYGLQPINGVTPLHLLLEQTDPSLVYFEMDLFWTTAGGADPLALFNKYPGRYHLMHVKDMKKKARFSGDGGDPNQWIELFPNMTSAGEGVLDLKTILTTAKTSGVKHFFVEQDMVADPDLSLKKSIDYIRSL